MNRLVLWLAQGFGLGRLPLAPGTFGSMGGLLWFALLLSMPSAFFYATGMFLGVGISVVVTGLAEKLLGQRDPSSVVLDEIVAVPACFASWIAILSFKNGQWPTLESFFGVESWPITLGVFAAFRLFDVLKPWPVGCSQSLPGGFGVTLDDLLASLYVNLCVLAFFFARPAWFV